MEANEKARFNELRTLYSATPLPEHEFQELKELAKKYDKKMHAYLVSQNN